MMATGEQSKEKDMISIEDFDRGVSDLWKCATGKQPEFEASREAMEGAIAMVLFGVVVGGGGAKEVCRSCFHKWFEAKEENEGNEVKFERIVDVDKVSSADYLGTLERELGAEERTVYYSAPFQEVSYLLWSSKHRRRLCVPSRGTAYFTEYVAKMARKLEEYKKVREARNLAKITGIMDAWSKQSFGGCMVQGMQHIPSQFTQVQEGIKFGKWLAQKSRHRYTSRRQKRHFDLRKTTPEAAAKTAIVDIEDFGLLPCFAAAMRRVATTKQCDNEHRMFLASLCYEVGVGRQDAAALIEPYGVNTDSHRSFRVRVEHVYDNKKPCLKGCKRAQEVGLCPFSDTLYRTPGSYCMQSLHENTQAPLGRFIGLQMLPAHPIPRLRAAAVAKAAIAVCPEKMDPMEFWKNSGGGGKKDAAAKIN